LFLIVASKGLTRFEDRTRYIIENLDPRFSSLDPAKTRGDFI
jgi:hypothetical protein